MSGVNQILHAELKIYDFIGCFSRMILRFVEMELNNCNTESNYLILVEDLHY